MKIREFSRVNGNVKPGQKGQQKLNTTSCSSCATPYILPAFVQKILELSHLEKAKGWLRRSLRHIAHFPSQGDNSRNCYGKHAECMVLVFHERLHTRWADITWIQIQEARHASVQLVIAVCERLSQVKSTFPPLFQQLLFPYRNDEKQAQNQTIH